MVIFDCNGVLVDSEPLATAIVSQEFMRAGFALTPDIVARYFTGRRQADMFAEVEIAGPVTLLVGSERDGLPAGVVSLADTVARIPIANHSLNAAMAATVALYELSRMAR